VAYLECPSIKIIYIDKYFIIYSIYSTDTVINDDNVIQGHIFEIISNGD